MGAIYLTVRIDCVGKSTADGEILDDSHKLNSYLIKEAKVALVPFSAFGTTEDEGWFRASVGASSFDDINAMIPRLKSALAKLK
jgi:aspartate aminotransferase